MKNIEPSGFVGDLSDHQQEVLNQVTAYLVDKNNYKPYFDEWKLLKFCRAKKFKFEKIVPMIDKHIDFRKQWDINVIMGEDHAPIEHIDKTRWRFQETIGTIDKVGRPVAIMKKGIETFDIKMYDDITKDDMIKHDLIQLEFYEKAIMPWCSQQSGRRIEQSVQIGDVKGVGFGQMTSLLRNKRLKDVINTITSIRNENYPELQKEYIVVNAPWWFRSMLLR